MKSIHLRIALTVLMVAGCDGSNVSPAPFNMAPTISVIPDQSTIANEQSAPIAFSVSDEHAQNLSITASSNNQQVVNDSGLELGGDGRDRTLRVSPVLDTLGDSFITVIATDPEGLMASTTFLLTIDPQPRSMQQFTRTNFAEPADDDPDLVNAVDFLQDADDDDFADLLAQ